MSYAAFAKKAPVVSALRDKAATKVASGGLRIGEPNDAYEREADRVADEIMAGGAEKRHWSLASQNTGGSLRRKCSCGGSSGECEQCRQEKEKQTLQRKAVGPAESSVAPPIVNEVLNSPGRPLDRATRDFFEPRFGYDFSRVRIHTDSLASKSARALNADAYTVGYHMAFAPGLYAPGNSRGNALLAHELTHVLQQAPALNGAALHHGSEITPSETERGARTSVLTSIKQHSTEPRVAKQDASPPAPRFGVKVDAAAEPEFDEKPECLNSFVVNSGSPLFQRIDAARCAFETSFVVDAQFTPSCKCSELEYRQFIRGHITRDPDHAKEDRGDLLKNLPLGRLTEVFQEDGDTTASTVHYGHRDEPPDNSSKTTSHYLDAKGTVNQKDGCHFEGADSPFAFFRSSSGEVWDIELNFHGDILRKGKPIQRRFWTPIKGRFTAP